MAFNWARATLGTIPFVTFGARYGGVQGGLIGFALGCAVFGLIAVATAYAATCAAGQGDRRRCAGRSLRVQLRDEGNAALTPSALQARGVGRSPTLAPSSRAALNRCALRCIVAAARLSSRVAGSPAAWDERLNGSRRRR